MTETGTISPSDMRFHRSELISIPHFMFNRHGGRSVAPFFSLNLSYGVGDAPGNVTGNRECIKKILCIDHLLSANQIHEDRIYCGAEITSDKEVDGYDALITKQRGVGLLIQQADCQAILIYDPIHQTIAAIHCGWRGSVANIIGSTIMEMQRRHHVDPVSLQVAISPSLGPCCGEFVNYKKELPEQLHRFQASPAHFNFWDISVFQLVEAGVLFENIDTARICTACDPNYFSYRRAQKKGGGTTGRNGSVICLPFT